MLVQGSTVVLCRHQQHHLLPQQRCSTTTPGTSTALWLLTTAVTGSAGTSTATTAAQSQRQLPLRPVNRHIRRRRRGWDPDTFDGTGRALVNAQWRTILFRDVLRLFSVGAVVALFHDVILTIGIFSILQIRFDLATIAALLTIVGYSLNDTVVVFDRVRENLRKYKQMPLLDLMNLSLNETLSRTLMTSVTTLIALIAMFVLGPEVIKGFTFAMIWGVVVGTYSSIFVAAPILLRLGVKRDWSKPDQGGGTQFANVDA